MLEFVKGDMFEFDADIRVNTVNCVGVMGAGVALAFKQRYPDMFRQYARDCKDGVIRPGFMNIWKPLTGGEWIINFPTKRHWKEGSRYEDIEAGLDDLRDYLSGQGPVTVALPALGCGHGGLDWGRVSGMISEKLGNLDARILVFEPAASHQAGRAAVDQPSEDENRAAEQLGYELLKGLSSPSFAKELSIFALGKSEVLLHHWIGLLPSRDPGEREMQALRAIAAEMGRSSTKRVVALVHATKASEEVADLFVQNGVDTVLLLPFGVLARKALAKKVASRKGGSLTIGSFASPSGKWSRQLFAQTMEVLRSNSEAILLSDPEPEWFTSKGLAKLETPRISYVKYETTPVGMREALRNAHAKAIGRRADDGSPNLEYLLWSESDGHPYLPPKRLLPSRDAAGGAPAGDDPGGRQAPDSGSYALTLESPSHMKRRAVFEVLMRMDPSRLALTVNLAEDATDEDRRYLVDLGFNEVRAC